MGLDREGFHIILICALALLAVALGVPMFTSAMSASVLLICYGVWLAVALHRARGVLHKHNVTAVRPNVIVYVPGLGAGWMDGSHHDWLFGGTRAGAARPRIISVSPPRSWYMNLGDDDYVSDVLDALERIGERERDSVALVGSSRGAGVVLATLAAQQPETARIMAAVMLNGPFTTVRDVLYHRYGRVGTWVAPLVELFCSPAQLDTLPVPAALPPLFFVTSAGDTNLPPDGVKATAKRWGGRLLELGTETGHSLLLAPLDEKKRVQDFIVGGLAAAARVGR
jgi:acetyl esterase/lipase